MAAEVRGDPVPSQQRPQEPQQALRRAVLGHRPHRVVTGHQHVAVVPGGRQAALQPGELSLRCGGVRGSPRGRPHPEVVGGPAQQHGVQHQQPRRGVGARHVQAEAVVVVREAPAGVRGMLEDGGGGAPRGYPWDTLGMCGSILGTPVGRVGTSWGCPGGS